MDDVNDMDHSTGPVEQPLGSLRRREFLTKAAAAGVVAWSAPVILSRPAYAQEGGGGTPSCRPTIAVQCVTYDCNFANRVFPGITVVASDCPCSDVTQSPTTCIIISNLASSCGVIAYGNGTTCGPNSPPDVILSTGSWVCFDPDFPVFFGPPRAGNGAVPEINSNCTITFRLGIWAGDCPDADSPDEAHNCQTYDVTIVWNNSTETANCTFVPAAPGDTLCTSGTTSPCGSCP